MKKGEEELNAELEQSSIEYKVKIEQLEMKLQKITSEKLVQIKEISDG